MVSTTFIECSFKENMCFLKKTNTYNGVSKNICSSSVSFEVSSRKHSCVTCVAGNARADLPKERREAGSGHQRFMNRTGEENTVCHPTSQQVGILVFVDADRGCSSSSQQSCRLHTQPHNRLKKGQQTLVSGGGAAVPVQKVSKVAEAYKPVRSHYGFA